MKRTQNLFEQFVSYQIKFKFRIMWTFPFPVISLVYYKLKLSSCLVPEKYNNNWMHGE